MSKIIDEVREITANEVAKKQDAAKLNFPKIVEQIKAAAALGQSELRLSTHEINEYDKKLLQGEGFSVNLIDREINYKDQLSQYNPDIKPQKQWKITW